jgi:hypothetical protein
MPNITVTVDHETYRRAKVKAAENLTNVSAVVKRFLLEYAEKESEHDRLHRMELEVLEGLKKRGARINAAKRLNRWEANER